MGGHLENTGENSANLAPKQEDVIANSKSARADLKKPASSPEGKPPSNEAQTEAPKPEIKISNPVGLVDTLKATPVAGVLDDVDFVDQMNWKQGREPRLGDYISKDFDEIPTPVRLQICKLILSKEGATVDPELRANLEGLSLYYEDRTKPRPTEENKKQEQALKTLLAQLAKTEKAVSSVEGSETITNMWGKTKGILSGGTLAALKTLNNLPPAGKTAVFAGLVFAAWKVATSPSARAFLWTSAKWGGALFLANHVSKAVNKKGLTENIDRWIIDENKPYASYLGLNYSLDGPKRITNAFVDSLKSESPMGAKPFKDLITGYNPDNKAVSDDLTDGVKFGGVDKEQTGEVMHDTIEQVVKKFGPESVLYKNNPEVRNYWNQAMKGVLPWRQVVIHLITLDPDSVKLEVEEKEQDEKPSDAPNFVGAALANLNLEKDKLPEVVKNTLLKNNVGLVVAEDKVIAKLAELQKNDEGKFTGEELAKFKLIKLEKFSLVKDFEKLESAKLLQILDLSLKNATYFDGPQGVSLRVLAYLLGNLDKTLLDAYAHFKIKPENLGEYKELTEKVVNSPWFRPSSGDKPAK